MKIDWMVDPATIWEIQVSLSGSLIPLTILHHTLWVSEFLNPILGNSANPQYSIAMKWCESWVGFAFSIPKFQFIKLLNWIYCNWIEINGSFPFTDNKFIILFGLFSAGLSRKTNTNTVPSMHCTIWRLNSAALQHSKLEYAKQIYRSILLKIR